MAARLLTLCALVLLTACGGGSPTPAEPKSGEPLGTPPGATPSTTHAARVLELTNAARATARRCGDDTYPAAPPLRYNAVLERVAQAHTEDMAARNYFAHNTPEGVTPQQRMDAAGYHWQQSGENIAAGYGSPETVVQDWLNSPGHCANIMRAGYREIGLGYATASSGRFSNYWAQEFGTRRQ